MRDGLRLFVDYTNRWKAREIEAKAQVDPVPAISFANLKHQAANLRFSKVRVGFEGEQYKPRLPRPVEDSPDVRISYYREKKRIARLADKLISDNEELADRDVRRQVGELSFDFTYKHYVRGKNGKQKG